MGPDSILAQHLMEQNLRIGQQVMACWHNGHGRQRARARVVELRMRSLIVELLVSAGGLSVGTRLELPRINDFERWSGDHGVKCCEPVFA